MNEHPFRHVGYLRVVSFLLAFGLVCAGLRAAPIAAEIRSSDAPAACVTAATEVVFVDPAVADYQVLLGGLRAGVRVVVLRPDGDALGQMSATLAGCRDLAAVHIVSHGAPGRLAFGGGALDLAALQRRSSEVQAWRQALRADAGILLYGCRVGEGGAGENFIEALAAESGAAVMASVDATGAAALGGNWALEARTAQTHASLAFKDDGLGFFSTVLADDQNFNGDGGSTSLGTMLVGSFTFSSPGATLLIDNAGQSNIGDASGDNALLFDQDGAPHSTYSFVTADSSAFKLVGFALDTRATYGGATTITITGKLDGVQVAQATVGMTNPGTYGSVVYAKAGDHYGALTFDPSWQNIDEVVFTATNMVLAIDDIDVDTAVVPLGITSATYDASTGILAVTCTGMTTGDPIAVNKLTLTGEGGEIHVLTSDNATASSSTAFAVTLNATDKAAVNQILNKNGGTSTGGTTYHLAAAADWHTGATADATSVVTVSNVALPTITSATYDAATGSLVVTGTGLLKRFDVANDIVANRFTLTGDGASYQLSDTSNVEITSGTAFTLGLSATDREVVNQILNKAGTSSTSGTAYNLAAAEDWNAGADAATTAIADPTGNGITVSNVAVPTITSATYNAATGALMVTGTNFLTIAGASNDIDVSKLTITGDGAPYLLTSTSVDIMGATLFLAPLNATDRTALLTRLNKNGTASLGPVTYNLAAAEDWNAGADAVTTVIADPTGNGITVSGIVAPTVSSAAASGIDHTVATVGGNVTADGFAGLTTRGVAYGLTVNPDTSGTKVASGTATTGAFTVDLSGLTAGQTYHFRAYATNGEGTSYGADLTFTTPPQATKLLFTTQPATSASGSVLGTQPVVTAVDASNAVDTTYTGAITLSESSAGALSGTLTKNAVAGVATFTDVTYTATTDQEAFTLTTTNGDGLTNATSASLNSNVVATKLVFQTQPAPLTTHTGVALDFATDPVVRAVDANDVVDTGWTTDVTLAEVNGAGSATMTVTGETDGDSATATVTPSSGVATFANLVVTYTNSGAAAETFNLRASSGGLTTADSSVISSSGLPALTSAAYSASTGTLVVIGTDFEAKAGLANDVDVSKLTFTGEGGGTHTLTDSPDVEIDSATQFTVALSPTDTAAVNLILNKNGTSSTGGTPYNLAAADDFVTNVTAGNTADLVGNSITVSGVAAPAIASAAYDYAANTLTLTGTGFLSRAGATNDIDVSTLTITGDGGAAYALSTSADVEITSGTTAVVVLSGADVPQVEALLNKNGATSATSATPFNLAAGEDWNIGADAAVNIADATSPITVSNYAAPAVTSAAYDASTGVLVVTGANFVAASGANNDVDASLLTLRGGTNETVTLTDTSDVEVSSATTFVLTLTATDRLHVNGVLNKNGTSSGSGTTYNLEAADNWMAGSPAVSDIADATGNVITVSSLQPPTITSATYDTTSGTVVVTGTNFVRKPGAANDVDLSTLTFTGGVANATYTLTTATDVEITSATSFTATLSGTDRTSVDVLLDQLGVTSSGGSTYNLTAADNWLTGADVSTDIADAGPNAVTVTVPPSITSATYNATTGVLVVTGANFEANGGGADIDASKLTLTGEGVATYTLTDTPDVERDSLSQFTVTLSVTDKSVVNRMLNKNGTSSTGGTSYNLAALDDYVTAMTVGNTADATNAVTVSNVAVPTIASATYNASTGVLAVTGTGFLTRAGDTNDIDVSKLTLTGQAGAAYALTSASVDVSSGTAFSVTLNATDRIAVTPLLNQNGTTSVGGTTYNLAAAEDWAAGADPAVAVADESGNGVTVTNADSTAPIVSGVTSATADGRYKAGATISIQVNFTENVFVTGTPQLTLETGTTDRTVDYAGGSGSSSLTFTYTVQAGDTAADLDYVATNSLALNGGSIRDLTGNNATLTLASPGAAGSLGANKALVIDTTAPTVSTIARQTPTTVNTDAVSVTWRVTFAEAVTGASVDEDDFTVTLLDGAATGTVAAVTPQSALIYDVAVNVSGQGALRLDLNANGTGIVDLAGNAISGGFTAGDFYLVGVTSVFDMIHTPSGPSALTVSNTTDQRVAQRFTTAADEPLTLTSVTAIIGTVAVGTAPQVTLHASLPDGGIGAQIAELDDTGEMASDELYVWTSSQLLTASTTYWLVFGATTGSYEIEYTTDGGGVGAWLTAADRFRRVGDVANAANVAGPLQLAIGATSTPVITSSLTASGTYGTAFVGYTITATNTPTSFAATGLPTGLSLNTATGVISGTPTQAGTFNTISLTATNASGTGPASTLVLTIAKAPLTVTANNASRYAGYANPTFTVSYSGFRNGDTAAALTTAPTATTTATTASPAGTYPITPAGGVSNNYDFTYVNGQLTVSAEPPPSKLSQTITFTPLGNAVVGDTVTLSASASSGLPVSFSLVSGPATLSGSTVTCTAIGVVTVRATQAGNASYNAAPSVEQSFTVGLPTPTVTTPTQVPAPEPGGTATLTVPTPLANATYRWQRNGADLANATAPTLTLPDVQPPAAGLYTYTVQTPGGASATSEPVIVGVATTEKVAGTGDVVNTDIQHPNGNVYDQLILEGSGASLTADPGQITRMSFVDLSDDIVQVEFSGAGTLSLVMDNAPTGAPAANYNQPGVNYVRGNVGIVITGANETTNVSVISVGRITAVNQALFRDDVAYDGVANVAFIAIQSTNGKFGGVYTGNVEYFAAQGCTGLYAPGVAFSGPVNIGDIQAHDNAQPVLVVGSAPNARITGGSLAQPNGQPVQVDGLTQLTMAPGRTSQGDALPAQANQGVLQQDGIDVTDLIIGTN